MKYWKQAAALYVCALVLTFGHAATKFMRQDEADYRACLISTQDYCHPPIQFVAGSAAFFSSLAWPLYWSWRAWEL